MTRPEEVDGSPACRGNAHDLERLICDRMAVEIAKPALPQSLSQSAELDARSLEQALANADLLAAHLRSGTSEKKAGLIESLVKRINLSEVEVTVQLDTAALIKLLGLPEPEDRLAPMTIRIPAMKVRRDQLRLIVPGKNPALNKPAQRDPKLVALIAGALAARKLVEDNPERSIANLAAAQGRSRTRLGNLVRISCLAPDIVQSIVEGRQPSSLNAKTLTKQTLPIDWAGQRKLLGLV